MCRIVAVLVLLAGCAERPMTYQERMASAAEMQAAASVAQTLSRNWGSHNYLLGQQCFQNGPFIHCY